MARGWESKGVEEQQAERERKEDSSERPSPADVARAAERRTIELARMRALADLAVATQPAHRKMLETALAALDELLARQSQ